MPALDRPMTTMLSRFLFVAASFAVLALFSNAAHANSITYLFTMNTSSLMNNTDTDFIDMQFSEATFTGPGAYNTNATATLSNFQTDGTLVNEDPYTTSSPFGGFLAFGDVTGTLTNPVVFTADGDGATNDYSQQITFGSVISFDLTLSGQGVTTPICPGTGGTECALPEFILDFIDATTSSFLFTNDPTGSTPTGWIIGGVNVNIDTTTTPFLNPGPSDSPSELTITMAPEPRETAIVAAAFIGMAALARRKLRAQHG